MREIKFRARVRTIHNAGKTYETYTYRWVYYEPMHGLPELPQGDYVMHGQADKQSTGLTDKRKSQGLYDGDRVIIGGDVGVLVWDELDLCWALEIEDGSYQSLCRFYSYEEIDAVEYIGNEEKP